MFTSNVLNNKRFRQMKRVRLWKNIILWAISQREILPLVVIFLKKLINLHGGQLDLTANKYLKLCAYHPDSECCTLFHGNLSNPRSSEDTLLYLYVVWNMLKSADLHKTTSHQSFVINMYVITMAWRCISLWSFHQSLQRRREVDIFNRCQHISAFWSNINQKKKKGGNFDWMVNQ